MKYIFTLLFMACAICASAQNYGNGLPATDALGRKLPTVKDVGGVREKYVGLFYWTWQDRKSVV